MAWCEDLILTDGTMCAVFLLLYSIHKLLMFCCIGLSMCRLYWVQVSIYTTVNSWMERMSRVAV